MIRRYAIGSNRRAKAQYWMAGSDPPARATMQPHKGLTD
jgi:hypothetical protein